MKRFLPVLWLALASCGCSYGPRHDPPTACSLAGAQRLAARTEIERGAIGSALQSIERANAACPEERRATRGDEVKLLAELARCDDARTLAIEIDGSPDRGDGAWLSASVARSQCDRDAAKPPSVGSLVASAEAATASGDDVGARRSYDRAVAFAKLAHLDIHADCTHWGHRDRFVAGYVGAADGVLLVDHDHALVLSATDGRELRYFGHGKPIEKAAVSVTGRTVATASTDDIVVWSLDDAGPLARIAGHAPLALSADGSEIAYVAASGELVRASVRGELHQHIALAAKPTALAFSDEGLAVSLDDSTFRVFDLTGAQRLRMSHDPVRLIAPSGPGSYVLAQKIIDQNIIVGSDMVTRGISREITASLDDVFAVDPRGAWVATERMLETGPDSFHSELVLHETSTNHVVEVPWPSASLDMALTPGGGRVFGLDGADNLRVFDAASETDRVVLPAVSARVSEFSVAGDGLAFLVDYDGVGGTFDRARWGQVWTAQGELTLRTRFYPLLGNDSRYAFDQWTSGGVVRYAIYDARTGEPVTLLVAPRATSGLRFSASGRFVAYQVEGGWMRADLERKVEPAQVPGPFVDFADDAVVVEDPPDYVFLDPETFVERRRVLIAKASIESRSVACMADLRNCVKEVRSGDYDKNTARLDLTYFDADGKASPFEPYPHQPVQWGAPWSGRWVAVAYQEGTIRLYDGHGGKAMTFHPLARGDGGWAVGTDGKIEVLGDATTRAVCRIGSFTAPIAACPDLVTTGLLASFLR